MTPDQVNEFIIKHDRQVVQDKIRAAQHKNRQDTLNAGINIIVAQMNINTMAAFGGLGLMDKE